MPITNTSLYPPALPRALGAAEGAGVRRSAEQAHTAGLALKHAPLRPALLEARIAAPGGHARAMLIRHAAAPRTREAARSGRSSDVLVMGTDEAGSRARSPDMEGCCQACDTASDGCGV